ncbi:MAG: hypothetical protein BEN19_04345 [Epulopiscium sp. Nuni2H_MBin003]|nr:MAG: hypothetical protein BEN19_04345 [Epulopiscium sp. Nuni2H_MBin003]
MKLNAKSLVIISGILFISVGTLTIVSANSYESEYAQNQQIIDESILKIYTLDYDTMENMVIDEIMYVENINPSSITSNDIMVNMQQIADSLSENIFQGMPIVATEILEVADNKIIVIDLQDKKSKNLYTSEWNNFFQGSTGGLITTASLEETFLQRDYTQDWVDGVQFLYNGQSIPELDHINLSEIIYR